MTLFDRIKNSLTGIGSKLRDEYEPMPKQTLSQRLQNTRSALDLGIRVAKPVVSSVISSELNKPAFSLFGDKSPTRQQIFDNLNESRKSAFNLASAGVNSFKQTLDEDLARLNKYSQNAQAAGLTSNLPMGLASIAERDASPLYKVPVVGKAFKFFGPSDELVNARGKVMAGTPLTQYEKNILDSEMINLVAGVSTPIKSGNSKDLVPVIGKGAETIDGAVKQKIRFLVAGVDDLVKQKGMKPKAAETVNFKQYQQLFNSPGVIKSADDFVNSIGPIPAKQRVNILDYMRTPEKVLAKIGLGEEFKTLRTGYDKYTKELPEEIGKVTNWFKQLGPDGDRRVFDFLDGDTKTFLTPDESKIAGEIKNYLSEWADKLKLPKDKRITRYISHIFEDSGEWAELDPEIAKMIRGEVAGSVYDPFLQKRQGGGDYIHSVSRALDAYVKRGVRKYNLDPALGRIKVAADNLEESQYNYIKNFIDRVNLRPTDIDNLMDNLIKSSPVGYKFGPRPTNVLTSKARKMAYRGALGLNVKTALTNLSQGSNSYAELGEKYTVIGYSKVAQNLKNFLTHAPTELDKVGVLGQDIIQDRTLSATKQWLQKFDDTLFYLFDLAEKINRGAAYWGAKSKYLSQGIDEAEAISKAKDLVAKTQFKFGSIDTPVALQSDVSKTLTQFLTYAVKQTEFLGGKVAEKDLAGLIRWTVATYAFTQSIGKLWGMDFSEALPSFRFGAPPTLQFAKGAYDATTKSTDQFGNPLSLTDRLLNADVVRGALNYLPAGAQIRKTVQGAQAINQGGVYSKGGRLRFPVEPGLQPLIFGPNASQTAKEYYGAGSVMGEKQTARYQSLVSSGVEPARAYELVKSQEEPQGIVGRISNAVSGLFGKKENTSEPQSALAKAYISEIEKDEQASEIRELYKLGLSDEELEQSLTQLGVTKEEADVVIMKALGVENGNRGGFIKDLLSPLQGQEYVDTALKLAEQGVLTTGVVDQWVASDQVTKQQGDKIKDLIKRAKGTATAKKTNFNISIPGSLSLPEYKSTKIVLPPAPRLNVTPIKAKRPAITAPTPQRIPVRSFNNRIRYAGPQTLGDF